MRITTAIATALFFVGGMTGALWLAYEYGRTVGIRVANAEADECPR